MEWTVVSCVVFAIFLSIKADPVVSSPQEDRSLTPDPAALYVSGQTVREGAQLMLQCYVKHGDTFIKERANSNLREQLKEGDKLLKEQIEESLKHVKEEWREGDDRVKELLDEYKAWMKEKLTRERSHLEKELAVEETKRDEEITELKKVFEKLRDNVWQWTQPNCAMMEDLKQQMSDFQAELNSTQQQLHTTKQQLQATKEKLQTTRHQLQTTQEQIGSLKASDIAKDARLNSTESAILTNQEKLQTTQDQLQTTQDQLQTIQGQVGSLKASDIAKAARVHSMQSGLETIRDQMQTTQEKLETSQHQLQTTQDQLQTTQNQLQTTQNQLKTTRNKIGSLKASDAGSLFIRWGHGQCPSNTSLVYSGVAGGTWYDHTGGGSNYLCLVMTPEMDHSTRPEVVTPLHGAEYEDIEGYDDQDVVCSVCRASQATTLMIPATRTCPSGWTTQYRGFIMAGWWKSEGRTEFVCVDEDRKYRYGGKANYNGVSFYHVTSKCGSLPCPPYAADKVMTCVVCSV